MRALGRAHGPMRDTLLSTLRAGRQASRSLPQIGLRVAQEIPGLRASSSASVAKSMRVRSAWSGTLSLFKGAKPLTWEGGPSSMPDRRPGGPALPLQPARFDSAVNSRDCVLLFSREFAANDGDLRDFFAALHLGWQPRSGTNSKSTAIMRGRRSWRERRAAQAAVAAAKKDNAAGFERHGSCVASRQGLMLRGGHRQQRCHHAMCVSLEGADIGRAKATSAMWPSRS